MTEGTRKKETKKKHNKHARQNKRMVARIPVVASWGSMTTARKPEEALGRHCASLISVCFKALSN